MRLCEFEFGLVYRASTKQKPVKGFVFLGVTTPSSEPPTSTYLFILYPS